MPDEVKDSIEKEIIIQASQEKVYDAISNQETITAWFPDAVEGKLAIGESPIFDFGTGNKVRVYVESAQPHSYFAYRWVPGRGNYVGDVLSVPNTLVEFIIEKVGTGTKVTLKETGFASLPADTKEEQFNDNTNGWGIMLDRFEKLFTKE